MTQPQEQVERLVERLSCYADEAEMILCRSWPELQAVMAEAASLIRSQAVRIGELEVALTPFGNAAHLFDRERPEYGVWLEPDTKKRRAVVRPTVADFARARSLLTPRSWMR